MKEKSLMQIEIFSIMINSMRKNIGKITLGRGASFLKCSLSARNLPIFIFPFKLCHLYSLLTFNFMTILT